MKNITLSVIILFMVAGVVFSQQTQKKQKPKYRAARSVHLAYTAPEGIAFYNEVTVTESHPGSYFSVCGFRHGYFGIQQIGDEKRKVVIFSIWDPGKQNNPNAVAGEKRVKVLYGGKGVRVNRFGGEGTGGKSMFPYHWKVGVKYRFMVKVKVEGIRTAYAAYFYMNETKKWKHLATFQTITGGDYLKGYYSFIEDFRRNGTSATQVRKANYTNGHVLTRDGQWIALTKARFTADRTAPTDNVNAGVISEGFFLQTGGNTLNKNIKLWAKMNRSPVDLKLPEEEKK